jgi:hypothetical protein
MKNDESQAKRVNVVAFPADKMEAVVEALKPILGYQQARASVAGDDQAPLLADLPGAGTACTRTSAQGSEDWSCTDAVAFE